MLFYAKGQINCPFTFPNNLDILNMIDESKTIIIKLYVKKK